jgi:hypothetical protein
MEVKGILPAGRFLGRGINAAWSHASAVVPCGSVERLAP